MEIRIKNIACFIVIASLFIVSCKSGEPELNPYELCSEFYELNKNTNFDELLFHAHILGIREYPEYGKCIDKYIRIPSVIGIKDTVTGGYLPMPSFKYHAEKTEKQIFFARSTIRVMDYLRTKYKLDNDNRIFDYYVKEIESIYSAYSQIKVPEVLPYANIEVVGGGNYIEFILYKNEEKRVKYSCYYAKDTIFSNDRQKEYFHRLPHFDQHWYYAITLK